MFMFRVYIIINTLDANSIRTTADFMNDPPFVRGSSGANPYKRRTAYLHTVVVFQCIAMGGSRFYRVVSRGIDAIKFGDSVKRRSLQSQCLADSKLFKMIQRIPKDSAFFN
jgi:hypothetical protein